MSSCLSGGIEILKSPSPASSWSSHSSSLTSTTLSESSNSPLAISTRKPRTPRKRLNQTYYEAASLLSTACPKIFPPKHLTKPYKFANPHDSFFTESPELLFSPIREKPNSRIEPRAGNCGKLFRGEVENDFQVESSDLNDDYQEDFDAESILDEEIEVGIDSIMGNLSVENDSNYLVGLGFGGKLDLGCWMRRTDRALKHVDERDWWRFPVVDVVDISPKFSKAKKEKKKKKIERAEEKSLESFKGNSLPKSDQGLLLKLDYEEVMNSWADRGTPFSKEVPVHGMCGNDLHARLAEIDLFSESGGLREANDVPYKEKQHTHLFSKKIGYPIRKVNANSTANNKGAV